MKFLYFVPVSLDLQSRLDLEASRSTATTSTLKLAALRHDSGSLVLVGAHTEVTDSLTGVSGSTDNQSVLASGGTASELVKGEDLTTSLEDTGSGGLGDLEGSNGDLGDLVETSIVSDGTSNNDDLVSSTLTSKSSGNARDRNRRSVDLGKEKRSKDDLVEVGVGTTSKESVELDQQLQVDVVGLGSRAVAASNVLLSSAIDTHGELMVVEILWCGTRRTKSDK